MTRRPDEPNAEFSPEGTSSPPGCGAEPTPERELDILRQQLTEARHRVAEMERKLALSERERRWMGLEIHDGLAQELAGAAMFLDAARAQLPPNASDSQTTLEVVSQLVRSALAESRRLIEGIRPPLLESEGLAAALEQLVREQQERYFLPLDIELQLSSQRLVPTLEMATYRIVQEGLSNARRHSQASRVRLSVTQHDELLRIRIEDNGIGFDPRRISPDRFGLVGIRERAELAGGQAVIESAPEQGTRITVDLPLRDRLLQSEH